MTIALAVVDIQNWMFRSSEQMAKLPSLIRRVNHALAAARRHDWLVFEIRTESSKDSKGWSIRTQRNHEPPPLAGSRDVETVAGLELPAEREVLVKTRLSAFIWTNFEARLQRKKVARLYLTGCWLDGSICQTAIDAYERNIDTAILADAVAGIDSTRSDFVRQWVAYLGDIPCIPLANAIEWAQASVS
jgi:bifunctional isochorismate lyase/aryl carrier protein